MSRSVRRAAAAIAAAALAVPALASEVSRNPMAAPAGAYQLDPSHANVLWGVQHLGLSTYTGRFNALSGKLAFDPAQLEKSAVEVTVDMSSVDTTSDELDGKLKKEAFETATFPTATFVSTKVTRTGDATGTVDGNLTLHGVTKPVTLNVTFNGGREHPFAKAYALGFSATGTIKRSEFGVDDWSIAVADEVTLTIDAEFIAQ